MIPLHLTANIEKTPWKDKAVVFKASGLGTITRIGRLPKGAQNQMSTVTVLIQMPNGQEFAAQTTLALFNAAAIVFNASAEEEGEKLSPKVGIV